MGKKTLGVGFVGCGVHASLSIFKSLTYAPVELVAVCDLNESRRRRNATLYGAKPFSSVDEMLRREKLEAVFVVGPFEMHYVVGKKCLEAGKHVWMEKPPGVSSRQTEVLAKLAKKKGLVCQVGTYMRFAPAHQMAKEVIGRKEFGRLHSVEIRYMTQEYPDLRVFFLAHTIHAADLVQYFAGRARRTFVRWSKAGKGSFTLHCSQLHDKGVISSIAMSSLHTWGSPNTRVELTGVGRHVVVENSTKLTYYRGAPIRPPVDVKHPGWVGLDHAALDSTRDALTWEPNNAWATVYSHRGYEDEVVHFVECVLKGKQPQASILDGLVAMRLVEAWEKSLKSEKEVNVQ